MHTCRLGRCGVIGPSLPQLPVVGYRCVGGRAAPQEIQWHRPPLWQCPLGSTRIRRFSCGGGGLDASSLSSTAKLFVGERDTADNAECRHDLGLPLDLRGESVDTDQLVGITNVTALDCVAIG